MRPRNLEARHRLPTELQNSPPVSTADLAARLRVSVPSVLRMLDELADQVVRIGKTKNARFALRRPLRGIVQPIVVYRIDEDGKGHELGNLELLQPRGSYLNLRGIGWPVDKEHHNAYWDGLPYPIYDMMPQGFLGRNFVRLNAQELKLPENLTDWNDDDIIYALTHRGADNVGNLIIGDSAFVHWQKSLLNPTISFPEKGLANQYSTIADDIMRQGVAGSSAAGEFPKFTAKRKNEGSETPHVIVKFSGADSSTAVQRWSDLLICEHIALSTFSEVIELSSARSRILQSQGRTLLELERFDRHGEHGRSEVVSLFALDAALFGSATSNWIEILNKLKQLKLADKALIKETSLVWWYGNLIANTDMHLGNLSFRFNPKPGSIPLLKLAPIYDMLPMLFAPQPGGEVADVRSNYEPALPLPRDREIWSIACSAALLFWKRCAQDSRISEHFRIICHECHTKLNRISELV